ncbi:MAG: polyprenyl synthetase family protein [Patescibacteria group bacterium]|nr:polyprenyl synthetase family protein [Patescibacteria group bacterium]MDD5715384.1 polyprenyl synthetase family protein [Patescibacteria group bacterium]
MKRSELSAVQLRNLITATLRSYFRSEAIKPRSRHPLDRALIRAIANFTLRPGAERSRGLLVLYGYTCGGKRIDRDALYLASAYEVLHSYLLIHDDIIDGDTVRRGKPTLHSYLESFAPAGMDPRGRKKIGIDCAIIGGDLAADLAQRLIFKTSLPLQRKHKALEYLASVLRTTYLGQMLDILAVPHRPPTIAGQTYRYILKTALYTIEAPFLLGVQASGSTVALASFRAFARNLGLAFQLTDDIQNVFGSRDAAKLSDVRTGKVTLLISFALQNPRYRSRILRLLRQKQRSNRDVRLLKELIIQSGGHRRAYTLARRYYAEAQRALQAIGLPLRTARALTELVDALKKRLPAVDRGKK